VPASRRAQQAWTPVVVWPNHSLERTRLKPRAAQLSRSASAAATK
jgi:hypothetical protein